MGRILVVEHEAPVRHLLATSLRQNGHDCSECQDVDSARRSLASDQFDAIFLDQQMPGAPAVLEAVRSADPVLSLIFLSAPSSAGRQRTDPREGELLVKPPQPDAVRVVASFACERTRLQRQTTLLRLQVRHSERASELYGSSPAIQALKARIAHFAADDGPILIVGELGTETEVIARSIHHASRRAQGTFVAVNCVAFTEAQLEAELFGHEKDAPATAGIATPSRFEAAHRGTLFLDAVDAIPARMQPKLERVLAYSQVLRAGALSPRAVDVRVLAASHLNLQQQVQSGQFRHSLFSRLAATKIHVPPLRERLDDVPVLSEMFSRQVANDLRVPERKIHSSVLEDLRNYEFPGNLRELRNMIERAYLVSRDEEILQRHLSIPAKEQDSRKGGRESHEIPIAYSDRFDLTEVLQQTEKALILQVLEATGGAQAEAARRMGLSRSVLAYKLTKYGIRNPAR